MNTTNSLSNTSLSYNRGGYSIKNDSVTISANRFQMLKSALIKLMLVVAIVAGGKVAWGQTTVTDVLNQDFTGVTGSTYTDWSGKTSNSSAVYAGQCAGQNSSIQLRTKNNNSGIITTTSGGKIKKVSVVWESHTTNNRELQIYGKNTAYSSASDLYNASTQGTLLGTIVYGTSTELTISGDYTYIGLRSADGAMYLTSISIDWEINSSNYSVLYDANGGTGTMTDSNSPYASGARVTVLANTFTAPDGMDFNGWNTAADGSGTYYDAGDTFSITENTTLYAQWITSGCRSVAFSSMGYNNDEDVSSVSIGSGIMVSFSSGTKYYDTGEAVRVYNNGTFTISSTYEPITFIRFTFGSGDGSNNITASTGTYSDGMWVGSASSVTFTVHYLKSNHRRIASIRACTGGIILLYNANGGTGTMIDTNNPYTSGSTVTTMTNDFTAPTDMEFGGWNTAADGSGDYYAEGASFTITANTTLYAQWVAPSDAGCPEITFSEQGYSDQFAEPSAIFGEADEITVAFNQGTSNNPPKYFSNGTSIRAYNGNTITVSVGGFNLITSIRLLFGNDDGNNPITANAGTYNSGVWSGSESSVTFTIGYSQGNHRRIAGIRVCTARPTSATVTYNGNGASGEVTDNNSPYDIDATVTVLGQGNLENECNTFAGWNTAADGSGTSYQEDDTFTITENVTLYAQWTPVLDYTISWLANGQLVGNHNFGCGSNIDVAYVPEDASVTSAMCDGSKVFVGWSETEFEETNTPSATILTHDDFSDITVNGNKTYYAVFTTRIGSPETCTLITNASTMTEGDSIVIVAESYNYALSKTQNNNNRGQASIRKEGNSLNLPLGENVCVFELREGTKDNTWAFFDANYDDGNGGYLFAASSGNNYLRTQNPNDANGSWSINITNGIATITAQGSYTRNLLQYNNSSNLFSCYASGQKDVVLYKKSGGYTYSAYTTFCPCEYNITGITDGDMVWAGKNANADWNSTINWTRYNEGGYHLTANAPTSSNNVYIIEKAECEIDALPHINENTTCNNLTMFNGLGIDIADNQTLTINGTATFTNGVINGNVIFGSSATVSGASASSHVDGIVTKSGAANGFTFPTGSNGNLGKVEVTDGTATNVSVQYFSNPAGFDTNDLPRWWNAADMSGENPFNHVSNVEYWKISSNEAITANFVAEASTDMHFNSETAEEDRIPANIQMAFYDNNRWTNVGGSASIDGNTLSITGAEIPASATRGISGNYTTFGSKSKSTVLPIELVSFTANCNGRSALIEWTTATEKNNDFFVLERSNDALNFKEIARIAGAGNSIEPISYAYTDFGVRNGDNYYRLVQVDYDGTSTASEIIVANCLGTDGEPEVLAYPNPFGDDLTLRFENFGNIQATVEVYDMLGRMVHTQKVNCSQNDYEVVLRLAGLSDGTYNVRISAKEFVLNKKVVKQ